MSVSVISQHVGFTTYVHFARTFRKLVGISPSQYWELYSLHNKETLEGKQTSPYTDLYEQLLGSRILQVQEAIDNLRQLGEFALRASTPGYKI